MLGGNRWDITDMSRSAMVSRGVCSKDEETKSESERGNERMKKNCKYERKEDLVSKKKHE